MARRRRSAGKPAPAPETAGGAPAPAPSPSADTTRRRAQARPMWLLVIAALLYTCYLASSLILPIVLAGFFALLLAPLMRRAPLRWLPRGVSALLVPLVRPVFMSFLDDPDIAVADGLREVWIRASAIAGVRGRAARVSSTTQRPSPRETTSIAARARR